MKKTNKKGFTIVELVIVIAVIAVLSAVLIPTFGSIIESANRSVDTQLVAQINTILAVEDILGGGVNDAVEIQKVIKDHGLKLQTKTKGQYIWYDIENKKAVLGGLDENGIVIEGNNARAVSNKGKFMATASSPEKFLNGYLFISQESTDGFAEKICSLRNANSASEIDESLTAITEINSKAGQRLSSFMDIAAVITSTGTVISRHGDLSKARVALVNSGLTTVTDATIDALTGTKIFVVDLHSGVTKMEFTDTTAKAKLEASGIYFYYNNEELQVIDRSAEGANISNLIKKGEIVVGTYTIEKMAYVKDDGTPIKDGDAQIVYDFNKTIVNNVLSGLDPYCAYNGDGKGTADTVYEFVGYSFNSDGSNPIAIGTTDYELNEYDKLLFQGDGTEDTIYAVYNERTPDFRITTAAQNGCDVVETHSYYPAGVLTLMLADNSKITTGTAYTNIIITSEDIVLDATILGQETAELTIPNGITLQLPYYTNIENKECSARTAEKSGDDMKDGTYDTTFDKAKSNGHTKLTIAKSTTLKNEGTLYVDAQLYVSGTAKQGFINSACGVLEVEGVLETTGALYAYGIVRGSGEVIAESGTVTEIITILDWHGGANASEAISFQKVTPFNNWVADNIRAKMTINHGVKYSVSGTVSMSVGKHALTIVLVDGSDSSKPLFVMEEGSKVQKTYDTGFNLTILSGNVSDAKAESSVSVYTIKFYEIPMPLTNFDIIVNSGAKLTVSNNLYKLLPSASVTVDEGGTLNIGTKVVVYNSFERTNVTKPDEGVYQGKYPYDTPAKLIVKGTLNFNEGAAFAGKITGAEGAVINANVAVGGHTFADGTKNGMSASWCDYKIEGLYEKPVLSGTTQADIAVGTYKYVCDTNNGVTVSAWVKQ